MKPLSFPPRSDAAFNWIFQVGARCRAWFRDHPAEAIFGWSSIFGLIVALVDLPQGKLQIPRTSVELPYSLGYLVLYIVTTVPFLLPYWNATRRRSRVHISFKDGYQELIEELERLAHTDHNITLYRLCPYELVDPYVTKGPQLRRLTKRYEAVIQEFIREANLDDYTIFGLAEDLDKVESLLNSIKTYYFDDASEEGSTKRNQTAVMWSPAVRDFWLYVLHDASEGKFISSYIFESTVQGELPDKSVVSTDEHEVELFYRIYKAFEQNLKFLNHSVEPTKRKSISQLNSQKSIHPLPQFEDAIKFHLTETESASYSIEYQNGSYSLESTSGSLGHGSLSLRISSDSNHVFRSWQIPDFYTADLDRASKSISADSEVSITLADNSISLSGINSSEPADSDSSNSKSSKSGNSKSNPSD
ncbi:MAG: hypothetical protein AAGA96_18620 [Verrucomicrobiota bacterium]